MQMLELLQNIAKSRGGQCLSAEYINATTKMKWRCKAGHEWETAACNVKAGRWCRKCAGTQKLTIEEMREIAAARGGRCLSKRYRGSQVKLTWQCDRGHTWKATPAPIKAGHWCPRCGHSKKSKTNRSSK